MESAYAYRSPLADTAPAPGDPLGNPITHRVVIVLIDALRYDTSIKTGVMPFLNELRTQGAYTTMHSQPPSFSDPAWATILIGAWPDINDSQPLNPPDENNIRPFTQDNIFAAADRAGLKTAVSGFVWFEQMLAGSGVDAGFYTVGEDNAADRAVVDAALPWLDEDYQLILIHLDQVDYAGHHEGGPRNPNWDAAATRADNLLREIAAQLDFERDTLIVLSDHGQIDRGGHGGPEAVALVEPFVLVGTGVQPGKYPDIEMVDVAPTVSALLGLSLPASNEGHALTEMLVLTPEAETSIQAEDIALKSALLKAYETAIGSRSATQPTADEPASYVTAMDEARLSRLGRERVWRNVFATFLAFTPAYWLYLRKDKKILWLAGGALIYLLVFNFRYAILDGRTYSLSSVESPGWLISYVAITGAIALLAGWLMAMFGRGAFRQGARHAAGISLGYVWFTIYLLALPVLFSSALNGVVVTWTLPELYSMYLALLSIIQWIIVAALGLVLTGLAALIGWLAARPAQRKQAHA
jgi:hypothetical protein